ncbi:hypothetical protein FHW16_005880 [Phyllobacterium myrsinacearum]|uniref:Uncharacterized protein n=1 Tax=Phyllobacterium myrsinacearum TaxID=28101 RepID=A0A839EPW6_9HYPH|nr:hypothetical protein [Phyllobacterium myrsinacearum]
MYIETAFPYAKVQSVASSPMQSCCFPVIVSGATSPLIER